MDFYRISTRDAKGRTAVYPDFLVRKSKDIMIRGGDFYAVWDEEAGMWSTDEYDVIRLIDADLEAYVASHKDELTEPYIQYLSSYGSQQWTKFKSFMNSVGDNYHDLDGKLVFASDPVNKSDYSTKRLPYDIVPGDCSAWDELIGLLYLPEERAKIEWAIGACLSGDSKNIQKFLVFYGEAGSGKSTILNIVEKLFEGYYVPFDAKAMGSSNNQFSTDVFRSNPLVAIQHDGDLSHIQDNTKLNSVVSHEVMTMNEKYKSSYAGKVNAFLFLGTNYAVKITDTKSGVARRLIDVEPSGHRFSAKKYHALMAKIDFELGAIAYHCLETYREMGKNYYQNYKPVKMMLRTNVVTNFVEAYFDVFKAQEYTTLTQAYKLYKLWCADSGIDKPLARHVFREEFKAYFNEFYTRKMVDGESLYSVYYSFNSEGFLIPDDEEEKPYSLVMEHDESLLDEVLKDCKAQYANASEMPKQRWDDVTSTLSALDTKKLHYVMVPRDHIVIDFDIKDESGNKSFEKNLEAASAWPATYAEISKGGNGIHLHYTYSGDVEELAGVYSEGIEVKTLLGKSSLRRKVTKCNNVPIAELNMQLPKKEKNVHTEQTMKSEKGLRELIERNLRKEIHAGTKPSIDFIHKILEDAYASGMPYDITDMRPKIMAFANGSTHQPLEALKMVQKMKWKSDDSVEANVPDIPKKDDRLVFYDVEVYPNLFVICWKYDGDDNVVRMINPSATDVENLFKYKLVGFNNRRYDNHILYGRFMGYDNESLYKLSQKIIDGNLRTAGFGEAYGISYADIYDFSSKKQTLKKFEIELGIHHMELDIPWDQPVAEDLWDKVVEYCVNDVNATEAVFHARKADFDARQILASISGLSVNDTTQKHTAKIIFGDDRNPQEKFVYTDLSKEFPGYEFDLGKSSYKGEDPGEGGYVYAEPGIYEDVALLDVASMHPTSIIQLNLFGEYTPRFEDLLKARLAIKHGDYEAAGQMLDGALKPYLGDKEEAKALSYALKIVINIVYGLTSAKFDNPFKDKRNKDNIVAKRGALFMIDLKEFVQSKGFTVAHIKTDSIKIPKATPEIIQEVMEFGEKYGYTFEHEATYEKFCLVNDAVYVARENGKWSATGAQFQHPYVFKTLFSKEEVQLEDLYEARSVAKGTMYLDWTATVPMYSAMPNDGMIHVGRTGLFVPVKEGEPGGILLRVADGKQYAVAGTKGYVWIEVDTIKKMGDKFDVDAIDISYYESLADEAVATINKFGSYEELIK